jgi:hypothetical protein
MTMSDPGIRDGTVASVRVGERPIPSDGLPVLGRALALPNFYETHRPAHPSMASTAVEHPAQSVCQSPKVSVPGGDVLAVTRSTPTSTAAHATTFLDLGM